MFPLLMSNFHVVVFYGGIFTLLHLSCIQPTVLSTTTIESIRMSDLLAVTEDCFFSEILHNFCVTVSRLLSRVVGDCGAHWDQIV